MRHTIMQKVINVLAVFSFLVSGATLYGAFYLYKNADSMIEAAKEKAVKEISEALPMIVEELIPDIPEISPVTGGAIPPMPTTTGPALPF